MLGIDTFTEDEETNLLLNQLFSPDLAVAAPTQSTSFLDSLPSWVLPTALGLGVLFFMQGNRKRSRRR
jgi:hypothetical protein